MQFNCMIDNCTACRDTKRPRDKRAYRSQLATNMIERVQLVVSSSMSCDDEQLIARKTEHDALMEFFVELEESCFICGTHGGNMGIVAHEIEKYLRERINQRRLMHKNSEGEEPRQREPKKATVHLLKSSQTESGIEKGPYKPK